MLSSGLLDFVGEKARLHECVTHWTRRVVTLHYAVRVHCSLASLASLWQVMFLNAGVDEEKALGAAQGFKVLTAEPETLDWLVPLHHDETYITMLAMSGRSRFHVHNFTDANTVSVGLCI